METPNLLALVHECVADRLPTLIAQLEGARAAAWARLASPGPATPNEERLLTMPEVAERLGITEHQAREMGRRSELPVLRVGERRVRVSARALEDWIRRSTLSHPRGGR